MVKSWVIYILGLCGMPFTHSFLTCMKKTPIFLLQFVLICEGVLCKKKKKTYMNCYLLLMLRHNSILTSTIRARFQLFFVEFFFLLLLTRFPELSFFAATIDNCGVYVYKMYMVYSLTFFKLLIFFCWLYIDLWILDSHCIYNRHVYIHYILVPSI